MYQPMKQAPLQMPEYQMPVCETMDWRKTLMELQTVEFALVELQLYLDTHPQDGRAVMQYNALSQQLHQLKCRYEQEFGQLMHYGFSPATMPYDWIKTPWPWEIEY
ncbi:spore coat protein CotJB [Rubeoparvulum massiliense]|uniref:spore coat protein CotJB n=1 Tax=Rubeoparvulum massiliense TaxID=1631346 RepID=UPI001E5136F5|nr:spore coat protein CotJB [Rubeoparvulum massiliense]